MKKLTKKPDLSKKRPRKQDPDRKLPTRIETYCDGVAMPTEPGSEEEGEWVCINDKWKWIEDIG